MRSKKAWLVLLPIIPLASPFASAQEKRPEIELVKTAVLDFDSFVDLSGAVDAAEKKSKEFSSPGSFITPPEDWFIAPDERTLSKEEIRQMIARVRNPSFKPALIDSDFSHPNAAVDSEFKNSHCGEVIEEALKDSIKKSKKLAAEIERDFGGSISVDVQLVNERRPGFFKGTSWETKQVPNGDGFIISGDASDISNEPNNYYNVTLNYTDTHAGSAPLKPSGSQVVAMDGVQVIQQDLTGADSFFSEKDKKYSRSASLTVSPRDGVMPFDKWFCQLKLKPDLKDALMQLRARLEREHPNVPKSPTQADTSSVSADSQGGANSTALQGAVSAESCKLRQEPVSQSDDLEAIAMTNGFKCGIDPDKKFMTPAALFKWIFKDFSDMPVVQEFGKSFQAEYVHIVPITPEVRQAHHLSDNVPALFYPTGVTADGNLSGNLYLDLNKEAGLLVPVTLHEMVHATDTKYVQDLLVADTVGKTGIDTQSQKIQSRFCSEKKAYIVTVQVIQKLEKKYPCYQEFIDRTFERGELNNNEIVATKSNIKLSDVPNPTCGGTMPQANW